MKPEYPEKTTDLSAYNMYHLQSFETHRFFEGTFFYNRHVVIIHNYVDVKKNNMNTDNNMILLGDDFRIGLAISPRVANTATQRQITRPIRKSSRNNIFVN